MMFSNNVANTGTGFGVGAKSGELFTVTRQVAPPMAAERSLLSPIALL